MWHDLPVLSILIWLPVVGAIAVLFFNDQQASWARLIALAIAVLSLVLCGMMYSAFDVHTAAMQFTEHLSWIPAYDVNYNLGVDGIAMPLILLTTFTTLWMYKRVFYGPIVSKAVENLKEVSPLDKTTFILLAAAILVIGVYPNWILNVFHASVGHLLHLSLQSKL